ncbi:(2Fe-2S)-binding protein [Marinobacter daepoensis]|uniref:(2Fe-2S)-binding protein n=1 Tax=Marinobacter daepoensis TaxID=262077 RepID=UPI00042624DE|nr:(2Fe-2S)-binding protein [Marinobacter daepoensis]
MGEANTGELWLADYEHLLASHNLNPSELLNSALAPDTTRQPALFSLAQLLDDPALLEQQVRDECPAAGHPRMHKACVSVLHKNLSLQIIGPMVIRLFRDGVGTALDPHQVFLCKDDPTPAGTPRWHHLTEHDVPLGPDDFAQALAEQMRSWYPVFRQDVGVSPGAYWSSVGLALGAPYSLVWNQVDPDLLCQQASRWLSGFDCDANRYIDWIPAEFSQQRCAIPQRRGCCLKHRLPEGGYCGTCGIYRKDRMDSLKTSEAGPQKQPAEH